MNFHTSYISPGVPTVFHAKAGKIDPLEPGAEDRRSIPSIQLDYCFSKVEESDKVSPVLVAIDCESKMVSVLPLPSKGNNIRGQAEHLVRFSMTLNYMDKVESISDAEPSMKFLL
eukprot:s3453_g9.t1